MSSYLCFLFCNYRRLFHKREIWVNIQPAKSDWTWTETIYIRGDGSVDPDTAPISTVDNITYTLTDNIVGVVLEWSWQACIVIERNNTVVDGAGYTVQGTGSGIGIDLSGRSNVTIKNMEIEAFEWGIPIWSSSNNTISRNNITANKNGISIGSGSYNNTVDRNNIATNEQSGVRIGETSYNTISGNDVKNNAQGIWLDSSSYNTLTENNIRNNTYGISLWSAQNNTISRNDIVNNGKDLGPGYNPAGITFVGASTNNKIIHNNFIDNFMQVACPWGQNVWDTGYPSGGNYWSDYTGIDADGDEIGDTPYVIPYMDQDNYPLMHPWGAPPPAEEGEEVPFWMQWWFFAIVAGVIVALVGTIYFLRKRKPSTAPSLSTEQGERLK